MYRATGSPCRHSSLPLLHPTRLAFPLTTQAAYPVDPLPPFHHSYYIIDGASSSPGPPNPR